MTRRSFFGVVAAAFVAPVRPALPVPPVGGVSPLPWFTTGQGYYVNGIGYVDGDTFVVLPSRSRETRHANGHRPR